ncbi:MAG: AAA family ATPase [Caldilineaceae bacterium]
MQTLPKLPIGIQHFDQLREEGYLYVDKTRQIYDLVNLGKFVFLSRPRRFGKSLLVTTIKAIYQGRKELFAGLWIEDQIDWATYPVIVLNFNDIDYLSMSLEDALAHYMDQLASEQGVTLDASTAKGKFLELIQRLSTEKKVVLLIDEYDKPITDLLENEEKVEEHVKTLKNFYSVLKSSEANHIHFTFLTGVSKYGKIAIFSDLNNLHDITLYPRFATLLGYTQEELEANFSGHLTRLAATFGSERHAMLERVKYWYNGYSWDAVHHVYVPFSTLIFLEQQRFANHWFSTGTPTFLIKLLRKQGVPAYDLERIGGDSTFVERADVNNIDIFSLLFQTGYLTVKRTYDSIIGQKYELGYPNFEVSQAFKHYLLRDYLGTSEATLSSSLLDRLEQTLRTRNMEGFINILRSIFGGIPHTLFLSEEAYYHSVVYLALSLLGFTIYAERLTNLGRIDAVLELDNLVYIIEFKMTTSEKAISQIRNKQYALAYQNSQKEVILLGIAFDKAARNISDWAVEDL